MIRMMMLLLLFGFFFFFFFFLDFMDNNLTLIVTLNNYVGLSSLKQAHSRDCQ